MYLLNNIKQQTNIRQGTNNCITDKSLQSEYHTYFTGNLKFSMY